MKEKILIVDDEADLLHVVETLLRATGYEVITAADGLQGLRAFYDARPDLVVLDIAMPEMDGLTACRRMRELDEQTPVVMLTAQDREEDIVAGLEAGADEYIVKPFKTREFLARIAAVLRRQRAWADKSGPTITYTDGYLGVDLAARRVTVDEQPVQLTPIEYKLLALLIQRSGQVVANREILENVWGPEYVDDVDYPRVYVWHLRRKIERDPRKPRYVLTEPGVGYRFEPQRRLGV